MKLVRNKRGEEKVFSIWWFAMLILVAVVVAFVTIAIFSTGSDVREVESAILYEKIASCLINNGVLVEEALGSDLSGDVFSFCALEKSLFENQNFYYVNVTLVKVSGESKILVNIGNRGHLKNCFATQGRNAKGYPVCKIQKEIVFYKEGDVLKRGYLNVIASSNQGLEVVKNEK